MDFLIDGQVDSAFDFGLRKSLPSILIFSNDFRGPGIIYKQVYDSGP